MQNSMPLPAVQMMLGHASPHQTSTYVAFSEDEIQKVTRRYVERESLRKTSARNSFFGKVSAVQKGDIQSRVDLMTMEGHVVSSMITNDSLERLTLKHGSIITAEIKAPWVILQTGESPPKCTADNLFQGTVTRIQSGETNTEFSVRISEETELCSICSTRGGSELNIKIGDRVWIFFNSYSVILHAD
jgi:molybdate transport system regulatory protein